MSKRRAKREDGEKKRKRKKERQERRKESVKFTYFDMLNVFSSESEFKQSTYPILFHVCMISSRLFWQTRLASS